MLCNQYDNATGQYVVSFLADIDPLNSKRWLVPAFCTAEPLPERPPLTWPFWKDGIWVLLPDYRGVRLYRTDSGSPAEITRSGVKPEDVGLTETPRPSDEHVWRDGAWRVDGQIVARKQREAAMNDFTSRMEKARTKNRGKADALAAGQLDPFERALFEAWAAYQMALVRVVESAEFPASHAWPDEPDEAAIRIAVDEKQRAEEEKRRAEEVAAASEAAVEPDPSSPPQ